MTDDVLNRLLTTLAVRIHAFAVCEIRAGWRLAFEGMDAVIVHYVLAGSGTLRSQDREVGFVPGSIIVVPAGAAQDLGAADAVSGLVAATDHCSLRDDGMLRFIAGDASDDTLVVCATISASYGGELGLFEFLLGPMVEDAPGDGTFAGLFSAMLREVSRPGIGTQALVEALMKQCLILLLRRQLVHGSLDSPMFVALRDERLGRAVTAILERPAAGHTVEGLAQIAGMSRSTFAERFSEAYGLGPIEFVQRVRLRIGTDLLRATALPIKVIAESVGYASRSYFTQAFRSIHGIDPTSYRERARRSNADLALASEPSLGDQVTSALRGIVE